MYDEEEERTFVFTITIKGKAQSVDQAWVAALEDLQENPQEIPEDFEVLDADEEDEDDS